MSLKAFHLFFIAVSVVLAAFVAAWAAGQYRSAGQAVYILTAIVSVAAAAGLIVYAASFRRKVRHL